jgi:hypothetical protein
MSNQFLSWLNKVWQAQNTRILLSLFFLTVVVSVIWWWTDSFPLFVTWLFGFLFVFLLFFFVWHFTKPLPGIEDGTTDHSSLEDPWYNAGNARIKRYWMTLSYCFMILALAAAVVPFAIDLRKDPGEDNWSKEHYERTDSPIGVFRGCIADSSYHDTPLYCYGGKELSSLTTDLPQLSWIVQIGGYVTPFPLDAELIDTFAQKKNQLIKTIETYKKTRQEILGETKPEQLQAERKSAQEALVKQEKEIASAKKVLVQLKENPVPTHPDEASEHKATIAAAEKELKRAQAAAKPLRKKDSEIAQRQQILDAKNAEIKKAQNELKRLVYAQDRGDRGDAGYSVEGGLVVPFYLIVLSLVGGGVSLTRRIPEYQKQSTPGYVGTKDAPLLKPAQLREYLVFQIVQFISAPFIAAVAYYVLAPATTAATVGLAFAAGFASETVLLWVRAVVDKLRPESMEEEPKGSLTGTVSSLTNSTTAEQTKQGATVGIIGHRELVPTYAPNGQFAFNEIPEGEYALEVRLTSNKICTQSVHIHASRTLPVWVECS